MKRDIRISKRQKAIKELIASHSISDQLMVAKLLKLNYAIDTTQAVVSRDLRQLGVIKKFVGNKIIYELPITDATKEILCLGVISVEYNETVIIIKTLPALAAFVADYLDAQKNMNILGTMAGENVVFVAPKSTKMIGEVYKDICALLYINIDKD